MSEKKNEEKIESPYLSTKEVAKILQVSCSYLYRSIRIGTFKKPWKVGGTYVWSSEYVENLAHRVIND